MNEPKPATVKAGVGRVGKFHGIWVVPITAFIIGLWMVYAHWASQGPLIGITFQDAQGIEAGKTKVRAKNVEIGEVLTVRLADDAQTVELSVRVNKENSDLLREDSRFWVVRPRVGPGGVSGLGTLLSGSYIEMSPGSSGETSRSFIGLEAPPATPAGTPGLHVTLDSDSNRALHEGAPILFHGMEVGTIEYVHFNTRERRTYYDAFIAAPYDRLITTNTQFWFSSGVSVDLSADGVRVDFATIETILAGGVSFGVPPGQPVGETITERAFFTIHPRESDSTEKNYRYRMTFVMLVDESIRGLRVGAPVEYRGVKVGQVLRTDTEYDEVMNLLDPGSRIPVMIEIVPARLGYEDTEDDLEAASAQFGRLLEEGLHASLDTGNLLTGGKYVELKYVNKDSDTQETFAGYTVIPSVGSAVNELLESMADTVDLLNDLPLDDVVASAKKALDQTAETFAELGDILEQDSSKAVIDTMNNALASVQKLASDFARGSETHRDLQRGLKALERTLAELEPVLRQLREKPNALVFGNDEEPDIEPGDEP